MHPYDLDSLRLLTRQRHQQRLREADAERLARESRATRRRRRRLRLRAGLALRPATSCDSDGSRAKTTMRPEPRRTAERLGLDQRTIRWLEAHGCLQRLGLTEPEIRARLYHAARRHGERGADGGT